MAVRKPAARVIAQPIAPRKTAAPAAPKPPPVTAAAREAIRARAIASGKKSPTTAGINATFAKNRATAKAKAKAAPAGPAAPGPSATADIYRQITGDRPGAAEKALTPSQYAAQKLNQFPGSPQLGKIDVAKGYAGDQARAQLAYLEKIGPAGYVGVNSGKRDDREYQSVLEAARRYAAMPTGVTSRNPNIPLEQSLAGEAHDAAVQGAANKMWNDLAAALGAPSAAAAKAAVGGSVSAAQAAIRSGGTAGSRSKAPTGRATSQAPGTPMGPKKAPAPKAAPGPTRRRGDENPTKGGGNRTPRRRARPKPAPRPRSKTKDTDHKK